MVSPEFSVDALRAKQLAAKEVGVPMFLSLADVSAALMAFLSGELSTGEIADWAEFYDANDDVVFESDEVLPNVLFEISSPEINGWLDNERAKRLLSEVSR